MPKYYKVYDGKEVIFVTVDDGGAVIIKDADGHKVFLSKYQAKLMKFGIENLVKDLFKDTDTSKVHIEEMKSDRQQ